MFFPLRRNPMDRLIAFLYKNDDGTYIDENLINKKLNQKGNIYYRSIIKDLESKEYIETNNTPGIPNENKPGIKISQNGREYWKGNRTRKWESFRSYIAVIISIITFWFSLLQPIVCNENKVIPTFKINITNKSIDTVYLNRENEFTLWLSLNESDKISKLIGDYEILNLNKEKISPNQSKNYIGKILNENRYFDIYKRGSCDFAISIGNSLNNVSNHLSFSKDGITENSFHITIE